MIRNKRIIYTFFIIIGVLVFTLGIAFAALSQTLNITVNKVTQQAMTWNIGFQTGTVTGTATGTNTNLVTCGNATATATSITGLTGRLTQPGDKCAYTFKIVNNGTITGKISKITVTSPDNWDCDITGSTMVCGNFTFKLRYNNATSTTLVAVNDTIAPKSGSTATTKTVVLTIEYGNEYEEFEDYDLSNYEYKLTFAQK